MMRFQTVVLLGSMALVVLVSATLIVSAQGAPAGLLRLDPPQPSNDGVQVAEGRHTKMRSAYAHRRKVQAR